MHLPPICTINNWLMLGPMKLPYWTLFAFFHYFVYPTAHTSECQADSCATAVRADKSSRSHSLSFSLARAQHSSQLFCMRNQSFSVPALRAPTTVDHLKRRHVTDKPNTIDKLNLRSDNDIQYYLLSNLGTLADSPSIP